MRGEEQLALGWPSKVTECSDVPVNSKAGNHASRDWRKEAVMPKFLTGMDIGNVHPYKPGSVGNFG